jgi:type II restriction/modification system DNA methylase subunit YeeA
MWSGIQFTDMSSFYISLHHIVNRTISIHMDWAIDDSSYFYNPRPAKRLYDWLTTLRQSLLKNRNYSAWIPSTIELVRTRFSENLLMGYSTQKLSLKISNQGWKKMSERISGNYGLAFMYEYQVITDQTSINSMMDLLDRSKKSFLKIRRKQYIIEYTFSYDCVPYYFHYGRQEREM